MKVLNERACLIARVQSMHGLSYFFFNSCLVGFRTTENIRYPWQCQSQPHHVKFVSVYVKWQLKSVMNSWIGLPEFLLLPELACVFFGCRPVCLTREFVYLYGLGLRVHQSCKDKFPGSMLAIACSLSNCWNKRHARLPATAAQEFVSFNDFVSNWFVL